MEFRDLKQQYKVLKDDIDKNIAKVISDASFISGIYVEELENQLAEYVGVKHCISCANGTDAISICLMALEIGPGDAVFVPDFTFFSTAECPAAAGAVPFFVDVKEDTFNIDPIALERTIRKVVRETDYKPKAVIAVDLFGQPAEYEYIRRICNQYNMYLIEDGAQGFGGSIISDCNVIKRACSFGDISTTSFFPAKPLGCYGDGGAIFTDDDEIADLIRSLSVHGKSTESKYDNIRIGMNSRLDTIQAAVLLVKYKAFREYELEDVNNVAMWYTNELKDTGIETPYVNKGYYSAWAQYTIKTPCSKDRELLQKYLKEQGIPTMIYYNKALRNQKAFENILEIQIENSVTESLCGRVLSLPIHPYMSRSDVKMVSDLIKCRIG